MKKVGEKIKEIRKRKGITQEELAESSKINLRKIQRIENNESEPRGKTLNLICEVLKINAEDILDYGKGENRSFLVLFHLSVITFLAIPIGNIILPMILWMTNKDKIVNLKEIGANVLNFQIIWSIITFLTIIFYAIFKILHWGGFDFLFYTFIGLYIINIVLPIIFAIKTKRNENKKFYPKLINIVK